jgi:hypothetical protein
VYVNVIICIVLFFSFSLGVEGRGVGTNAERRQQVNKKELGERRKREMRTLNEAKSERSERKEENVRGE